jgi:cytoskeletal protein CcmA (bactofilin family)
MLPQFRKPETDSPSSQPANTNLAGPMPSSQSTLGARPSGPSFRPGGAASSVSVIGQDLIIQGNLTSKGEVQIEGEIQGDIYGTHIVIGERARVTGGVIAEECVIRGRLLGTVRGRRVLLQSSSHVEGDIYHQTMAIEQGAFFEGKSRRTDDPLAGLARTARAPEQVEAQQPPPPPATPPAL